MFCHCTNEKEKERNMYGAIWNAIPMTVSLCFIIEISIFTTTLGTFFSLYTQNIALTTIFILYIKIVQMCTGLRNDFVSSV